MAERLIEVEDLKVQFATEDGLVKAVDGVSFELSRELRRRGKSLGLLSMRAGGGMGSAVLLEVPSFGLLASPPPPAGCRREARTTSASRGRR